MYTNTSESLYVVHIHTPREKDGLAVKKKKKKDTVFCVKREIKRVREKW